MFGAKVKINRALHGRLAAIAKARGYATVDEFILHVLEKAAEEADIELGEDAIREQLKGLGYIE